MRRQWGLALLIVGMFVLAACGATPTPGAAQSDQAVLTAQTMNVGTLKAKLDANEPLFLLDVRTPEEFNQDGRVAEATLIPLQELELRVAELPTDTPIACICRSGNRSTTACDMLAKAGFSVTNVNGGMIAWKAAGYPTE